MTMDSKYMASAIELARIGEGRTSPNPVVGAIIVKDNRIIGRGYHAEYGGLHAERAALASCSESLDGATMYVTLEPCCHHGKQPPCTEAIIQSGITHVVTGSADPNPLVAGKGIRILQESGIQVTEGFMREECDAINSIFFHYITTGTPYVVMKYAMTMDGKIATKTGKSQWITGEEARKKVHLDRSLYTGIMVGVRTVLQDDPMLNCRIPDHKSPVRIICDTHLRTPPDSRIVRTADKYRTIIATAQQDKNLRKPLEAAGCKVLEVQTDGEHISLIHLMEQLAQQNIDSILLEGGGTLNYAALRSGIVNKVQAYIGPQIFGGEGAPTPVRGSGIEEVAEAFRLNRPTVKVIGDDVLLESEIIKCSQE